MNEAIEKAIKVLTEKVTSDTKAPDAIHFTQAALNLAHTLQVLKQTK